MLARPENVLTNCLNHTATTVGLLATVFFAERVVSVWNFLPASVNFSTLGSFGHSITDVDFTNFLNMHKPPFSLFNHCDFIFYSLLC